MSSPTPEFRQARFGAPLVLLAALATACGSDEADVPSNPATETFAPSLNVRLTDMTLRQEGLYVQDLTVGAGTEAISGRDLKVRYTGWFVTGQQFDSNTGAGIDLTLGRSEVIQGWDLGLVGMRPGGKRRLVIGSRLAYGSEGRGSIGPNKTLVFEVTVVSVT